MNIGTVLIGLLVLAVILVVAYMGLNRLYESFAKRIRNQENPDRERTS